jgi:hypothetical protein
MTDGIATIITQLERQKTAIERALAALREIEGIAPPAKAPVARKGGMAPAGRRRISAALKKRWAARKAAEAAPAPTPSQPERRKPRLTPDGRERLAEAMRKRWAVKRAGSAVKKTARKQRAKKAA